MTFSTSALRQFLAVAVVTYGFPFTDDDAIEAFYRWWDEQFDAKAAVDAVWPKKRKAKAK